MSEMLTKSNWSDLDHGKHRHPVPAGSDGLHSGSHSCGVNFCRIEPWHREPARAIEDLEQENEGRGSIGGVHLAQ